MEILILGILILINGFFALSEIAIVSSKKARLEQMKGSGSKGATVVLRLLGKSEIFLSAIQVGITMIGIITGVYGGVSIADDLAPIFDKSELFAPYAHEIALTLTVVVITYFSIVVGELVPKTIALSNPEKIAVKVAPVISGFSAVFYPFVKILSGSTNLINKLLGIKKQAEFISEAELRQMIKMASHEGVIEKEQNLIHEKVFYFSDKKAKHIMTHRTDVEWIDIDDQDTDIQQKILGSKHSKLLMCHQTPDNFIGFLVVKEYLLKIMQNSKTELAGLITDPLVIPEVAYAQNVLKMFREKKTYQAVVVNEYGSFEGIITLHDIMENLVGLMPEEGETSEPEVFRREDESVLVSGEASVEVLAEIIEGFVVDFENMDYSTVAGFVLSQLDKIPELGDSVDYSGYTIEIIDIDANRIDKILIRKQG